MNRISLLLAACIFAAASPMATATVSVKDSPFNATGNGVTDDTAAIQAAFDYALSLGGDTVLIPSGTYRVSAVLAIGSSTHVVGSGKGDTVIRPVGAAQGGFGGRTVNGVATAGGVLEMVAADNASVENLTVDLRTNSTLCNGIAMIPSNTTTGTPCTKCRVQNCHVLGFPTHQYLIWNLRAQHTRILNNYCDGGVTQQNTASGQEGIETFGGYDVLIQGNTLENIGEAGINVGSIPDAANSECVGVDALANYIEGCGIGIHLGTTANPVTQCKVCENVIISPWTQGIDAEMSRGASMTDLLISGNSLSKGQGIFLNGGNDTSGIVGATVTNNVIDDAVPIGGAIYAAFVKNVEFSGNKVNRSATQAVYLAYCDHVRVHENTFTTMQNQGLYAYSVTTLSIKGNNFKDYGGAGGRNYPGILLSSVAEAVVAQNAFEAALESNAVYLDSACNEGRIVGNSLLYTPAVYNPPMVNWGTNPNMASFTTANGATSVTISNTLAIKGSRVNVTQTGGAAKTWTISRTAGSFTVTFSSPAAGGESYLYEIVQ